MYIGNPGPPSLPKVRDVGMRYLPRTWWVVGTVGDCTLNTTYPRPTPLAWQTPHARTQQQSMISGDVTEARFLFGLADCPGVAVLRLSGRGDTFGRVGRAVGYDIIIPSPTDPRRRLQRGRPIEYATSTTDGATGGWEKERGSFWFSQYTRNTLVRMSEVSAAAAAAAPVER